MKTRKFSLLDRLKSFKYALNGIRLFFLNEHNGRIHLLATFLAVTLGAWLKISALEWIGILSVIALVLVAEMLNTAIEKLADVVTEEFSQGIKVVKDVAAGGVLVSAIIAFVVGLIIFGPKLFLIIN